MVQFPRRRESDQQAEKRAQKIKDHNEALGCNLQGQPVDADGQPLKGLSKKEFDVFNSMRKLF